MFGDRCNRLLETPDKPAIASGSLACRYRRVAHGRCKTDGFKVAQDSPTGTDDVPEPCLLVKWRTACTLNRGDWYGRVQHVYWGV